MVRANPGLVTSSDELIDCGNDCEETYIDGDTVTLTAENIQDSGYYFTGWTGGGCTGTDPCTVTMDQSRVVTANFDLGYTLTVNIIGGGGKGRAYIWDPRSDFDGGDFYCYDTCYKKFGDTYEFPIGQYVVIKRKGTTFFEWGGDCHK